MKKFLIKVLCGLLAVTMLLSFTACGDKTQDAKWQETSMTNWGAVNSVGGFVAETDNYLYYINGIGSSTAKNDFGTPIKGALMAANKTDLSKTEIVVPKLFVASDYNAGVYIYGDYVYYGSPSTDKTPDGDIAYSEMMFIKTKLDGTDSKVLFTVDSLSTEYRFVEVGGKVFVVYYDATESELVSYNTADGAKTVIAKTDAEIEGKDVESLDSYFFLANENLDSAVVLYTTTIYTEEYNEEKVEAGVARATANYNKVYAYKAGATSAELVFDGKNTEDTTAITLIEDGFVFFTQTNKLNITKTYGATVADFVAKKVCPEIDATYAVAGNVIKSLDEVYVLDSENGKIYKDTMVKASQSAETKQLVAMVTTAGSLIDVIDGFVYYYNSNNEIAKLELNNADANEIRVSEGSVAQTWYAPEFVEVGGKTLMFYCDNSSTGLSYIKYVDINAEVTAEDTDEDDEDDFFYIDGAEFIGQMVIADKADLFEAKITAIADKLEDGVIVEETETEIKAVREEYEKLESAIKDEISESSVETLEKYERAVEVAELFAKLDGIKDCATAEIAENKGIKAKYDEVKSALQTYYAEEDYTSINALISQDLKANYTKAVKLFETESN